MLFDTLMSKEATCIKVPKAYGEKAIVTANKLKIVNKELEIQRDKTFIYIPLLYQPSENELKTLKKQAPECKVSAYAFPERKKRVKTFVELLENELPSHLLASSPRAMDLVGDIAIIEIPPELDVHKRVIGEAVLKTHKNVQTVLAKAGVISGTYRLREFSVIAGEPKTDTVHKEHGYKYYVDLTKVYFSPRLSHEHNRVASLVKDGETIVDLFAGVGPFSILIAKTRENVKIYAIDANPYAIKFLKKNIRLNRVESQVYPILGDAKQVAKQRFSGIADRVIMNLPEKAMEFVDAACTAVKPAGGMVHFYSFVNASNSLENVNSRFIDSVQKSGRKVEEILFSRLVRTTAPHEWQAVLDAKIH